MRRSDTLILFLLIGVCILFFFPIFLGKIPFPADLLVSEYSPWKYASFLGYAPGAFPEKFQYFDVLRQIYPWTTFSIKSLQSFLFPLWNPYNFSGAPLFANSQSAVLYPLHLLYFILPQTIAWTMLIMLQPLLSSIGTYVYGKKIGIGKWGSMIASISFGYCLFISVFLEYNTIAQVVLFLPFLLLGIEYFLERKTLWPFFLIPLGFAFSFFAGHIQIFGFIFLFCAIYAVVRSFDSKNVIANITGLFLLFFIGLGIAAVQLVPTFELIQNAARSIQEYAFLIKNLLLQPQQALLFLSPDLFGNPATRNYLLSDSYPGNAIYIGFIPIIFSLYGVSLWKKHKYIIFFSSASAVLALIFFNSPFTQSFYRINIPFFSTGSPTNAIFLLSFSLCILAGFGFEKWLSSKDTYKAIFLTAGLLAIFLLSVGLLKISHTPLITNSVVYTLGLGVVVILLLLSGLIVKDKQKLGIILIIVTILDLFYFFQKFNPFSPISLVFPQNAVISYLQANKGINRFYSYGNAFIQSNIATQFEIYDSNGYDPLYPKWYAAFIESAKNGKIPSQFSNQDRSDANLPQPFTAKDFNTNNSLKKAIDLLGVKYILAKGDPTTYTLPQNQFGLLFSQDAWQIFDNKEALPRAFLAYQTVTYSSNNDFGNKFYSSTFNPRTTILLNTNVGNFLSGPSSVMIRQYSPNKVTISTASTTKGLLFLSDTYYPGWIATIDGEKTPIIRADYAFRAVIVPQGDHEVIFSYNPPSFSLGLTLTIISLGVLFVTWIVLRKQYEK